MTHQNDKDIRAVPTIQQSGEINDLLLTMRALQSVFWTGRSARSVESGGAISHNDIIEAEGRFERFAPLLKKLFPVLAETHGKIESKLVHIPRMQQQLGIQSSSGALFLKADHALPIAGSIKARGGFHEVLDYVESCAMQYGLMPNGDYTALATPASREALSKHELVVGSTGNLGLAIGLMGAKLGLRVVVHMSADAKAWKKNKLRENGVCVIEHEGDYGAAVAAGRRESMQKPFSHFVDDEKSSSLFVGYAAAARHLSEQLTDAGRVVDKNNPLFVYIPCGVGGAPGGIATGLHHIYGEHVHCFFAEPIQSPCFLLQMLFESGEFTGYGSNPSVYDLGLNNLTQADGLAVPRASLLAAREVRHFIGGVYTVPDGELFRLLYELFVSEGIRIEPSAAAGLAGPGQLLNSAAGQRYLQRHDLAHLVHQSTHIAWSTGGLHVPDLDYSEFMSQGEAMTRKIE